MSEMTDQATKKDSTLGLIVLVLVIMGVCLGWKACTRDVVVTDLSDSKYDLFYECVDRQKDAGYLLVDAYAICDGLKPEE
jgi:hypothetical protein